LQKNKKRPFTAKFPKAAAAALCTSISFDFNNRKIGSNTSFLIGPGAIIIFKRIKVIVFHINLTSKTKFSFFLSFFVEIDMKKVLFSETSANARAADLCNSKLFELLKVVKEGRASLNNRGLSELLSKCLNKLETASFSCLSSKGS